MYQSYYNPQASIDRINNQIAELEKMKASLPQAPITSNTPAINQTFQLAPQNSVMKYANSIDDVKKEIVISDTPFFSNDLSVLWVKNTKGNIKSYELKEIVEKDAKDIQIELLQTQIEELKGMIQNEHTINDDAKQVISTSTTKDDDAIRTATKENEPTSIQRVQRSKTK